MEKLLFNTKLVLLIGLVLSIGMMSSCKKDSNADSGEVQLLSFGPSGAMHGDTISFIGNNLEKVTEIDFVGANASVLQSAFISQTSELITLIVPETAEQGVVTLKTANAEIVSITKLNLNVPVVIESVPATARPGETITIKGKYMNWINEVWFAKDVVVRTFESKSLTELILVVPANAQSGPIVFSSGGTEPLTIETEEDLVVALPAISGFTPNPIEREANLTITGTNLDLTAGILFSGVTDTVKEFVSKSATQLVVKVPKTAVKGKIALVAFSNVAVSSDATLKFIGDLPDLDPLAYAFYTDDYQNGWQNDSWGVSIDEKNTENVRSGNTSIKRTFGGSWGRQAFVNSVGVSTAPYTQVTFSIFGTVGTDKKEMGISLNGGTAYKLIIEEGKWVEYKLNIADLGSPEVIKELEMREHGFAGTIYIDHVGLK